MPRLLADRTLFRLAATPTLVAGLFAPLRSAAAQPSPCHATGAFPKGNRLSEADRNTFIYNLPGKLLSEETAVESRSQALAEAVSPTCLRVDGRLIEQDFWNPKRLYVSDGTRLYTVLLTNNTGAVDQVLGAIQYALACRAPTAALTLVGEFAGIEPAHEVRRYHRYWGRAQLPAAIVEPGPITVQITNPKFVDIEHPVTRTVVPWSKFAAWHERADTIEFDSCAERLDAYRANVTQLLRNASRPEAVLRAMNDSINATTPKPFGGVKEIVGKPSGANALEQKAVDAERADTACQVKGLKRLKAAALQECRAW